MVVCCGVNRSWEGNRAVGVMEWKLECGCSGEEARWSGAGMRGEVSGRLPCLPPPLPSRSACRVHWPASLSRPSSPAPLPRHPRSPVTLWPERPLLSLQWVFLHAGGNAAINYSISFPCQWSRFLSVWEESRDICWILGEAGPEVNMARLPVSWRAQC